MKVLIKQAKIIAPQSIYHERTQDILIEDGKIAEIADRITAKNATIIDNTDICVSSGWFDTWVQVGDPGFEHREDLDTATMAAAKGGFTAIACLPNTAPAIHSKSQVLYVKNRTQHLPVKVHPIGAISEDINGKDITEIYDMQAAGAIAFSDGKEAIQDGGLLMRSLQYVKKFNGLIINHPHHHSVAAGGQIHEGYVSTILGMKGIPNIAEELMVQRDIYLAEYTNSRLHIANISTARAVDLIREAKAKGIQVTSSVAVLNLIHTDQDLLDFDSNLKVSPPLREEADKAALIAGVKDGTIDIITANHIPVEEEGKKLEFSYANYGAIGLQTIYSLLQSELELDSTKIVETLATNPRQIMGVDAAEIAVGAIANLTIFQPNEKWTFTKEDIESKSVNTSFIGKELTGKVVGIVNGEQVMI